LKRKGASRGNSSVRRKTGTPERKATRAQPSAEVRRPHAREKGALGSGSQRPKSSRRSLAERGESLEQERFEGRRAQAYGFEKDLAPRKTSGKAERTDFEEVGIRVTRLDKASKPLAEAFLKARSDGALPLPLRQYLDSKSANAFVATNSHEACVSFLGLWFDNLGPEACARVSYWIDSADDIAVRRWIDANLLDAIIPFARSQDSALVRLRTHVDDEARQGALAAAGFEHVDDVMLLRANVPKQMDDFMMKLGILWTLRFERTTLKDVVKLHNEAYHDDIDVVRLSPEQVKHIETQGTEIWLATAGQKPVGFVEMSVQPTDDPQKRVGRVDSVAVLPYFRDQGIGSELTVWALDRFSKVGVRHALLQVRGTNNSALRVYKKLGFEPIAKQPIWQMRLKQTASATPPTPPVIVPEEI
jgi:ribosomal protein S18 acetylase RimI-like enzyme